MQPSALLRRGRLLESTTLAWNVAGIFVLALAAVAARSVALAGFGLDSLIEIGASVVVLWELSDSGDQRQATALRSIGVAFGLLAVYLAVQSSIVLAAQYHPHHSALGIVWTAVTALVMFTLAAGKARTGRQLDNPVLQSEGKVTLLDGLLASAVCLGLLLNTLVGWWWADPLAGYVILAYGVREGVTTLALRPLLAVYLRVAKRLVREPHLPRPLRWLLVFAVLPIPGPVDELALVLAAGIIAIFYRSRFRAVLSDERGTAHSNRPTTADG